MANGGQRAKWTKEDSSIHAVSQCGLTQRLSVPRSDLHQKNEPQTDANEAAKQGRWAKQKNIKTRYKEKNDGNRKNQKNKPKRARSKE